MRRSEPCRYVLRRLGQALPTVAGLLLVTFLLIHLAPGDPVVALGGEHGDAGYYALIRAKFGLDRPLLEQFFVYAGNVIAGNLGTSFVHGRPVIAVIGDRLPATLLLMSVALALVAASPAWPSARWRRAAPSDPPICCSGASRSSATPRPRSGSRRSPSSRSPSGPGVFPVQGMTDARRVSTGFAHVVDVARHLALPALVLAANELALTTRLVRTGLLEALGHGVRAHGARQGLAGTARDRAMRSATRCYRSSP